MKKLIPVLLMTIFYSQASLSYEINCQQKNRSHADQLKIDMTNEESIGLFLKPQKSDEYIEQRKRIQIIENSQSIISFSAKTILENEIDWSKEELCYKEVGTIWYFNLNFETGFHYVQFYPDLVTETPMCRTPRYQPQTHILDCQR